jgi:hypothetical protein
MRMKMKEREEFFEKGGTGTTEVFVEAEESCNLVRESCTYCIH